jgi:peptidoglycan/xylan/chitin deacetylase (PgdA/CDA1 family)
VTDDYSLSPYTPVGFNRALVSLTFDDAWASIYNNGFPLLQKYSLPSTQYLISGNIADPAYMTAAMMKAMGDAGHEVASHTGTHPDLTTLTATQLTSELANSQKNLKQYTGKPVTDFASPYGTVDTNVMKQIKKYYISHRGVVAGFNSKNYFNPYDIKVQNVTSTTLADVQGWIAQAQATKTWLVLVYHQVDTNPAAGDFNTTPAQLDAQLGAIKTSAVPVVTVAQALAELTPQL